MKVNDGILFEYSKAKVGIYTPTSYRYGQKDPNVWLIITPWQNKEHKIDFKVDRVREGYELNEGITEEDMDKMEQALRQCLRHDMTTCKNHKYVYCFTNETGGSYSASHEYNMVMWVDKDEQSHKLRFWFAPVHELYRKGVSTDKPADGCLSYEE